MKVLGVDSNTHFTNHYGIDNSKVGAPLTSISLTIPVSDFAS